MYRNSIQKELKEIDDIDMKGHIRAYNTMDYRENVQSLRLGMVQERAEIQNNPYWIRCKSEM